MSVRYLIALVLLATPAGAIAGPVDRDRTEAALDACLAAPGGQSTAGQTECETTAAQAYDRRMSGAYAALMRRLPPRGAARLRLAQRAWLAFREADAAAQSAAYETRQGTMYVPMQAAAATRVVQDRAHQLEALLRVMTIDDA